MIQIKNLSKVDHNKTKLLLKQIEKKTKLFNKLLKRFMCKTINTVP